jgi:hypothetical protein
MLSAVVPVKLFSVLQVCVEPMTTGPNVLKLFTFVINKMFTGKAEAYLSGALFRPSTLV